MSIILSLILNFFEYPHKYALCIVPNTLVMCVHVFIYVHLCVCVRVCVSVCTL